MLTASLVMAQSTVSGTVKDDQGETIPGANVLIKGTNQGTVTNINGKFSLEVSEDDAVLIISFVGFESQEVAVNGRSTIDVTIVPDVAELQEVVVVGYGAVRKSDITGAVTSVRVDENVARQSTTVDQLLQGRAAGVQVTGGGQPGSGVSVRIRGTNSLRGNNEPLYVVDGVIFSSAGEDAAVSDVQVNQNGLNGINPRDIESIEVLKDASATAIYGSRGANGVILITTKKGTSGKARVNAYATTSITQVTKKLDVLNGVEYARYRNETAINDGIDVPFHISNGEVYPITYTNGAVISDTPSAQIDWQDEMLKQANDFNAGISISGGSDRGNYYVSAGFLNQEGLIDNSLYQTGDFRINVTQNVSDKLTVSANLYAFYGEGSFAQDGDRTGNNQRSFISNVLFTRPLFDGDFEDFALDNQITSPYSWVNDFEDISTESRFVGRLMLKYKLPVKGLEYEISAGGNIRNKERSRWQGVSTFLGGIANGTLTLSELESKSYQINNLIRYRWNTKDHRVQALLGNTIDGRDVKNSSYTVEDFVTKSFTVDQPSFGQSIINPLTFRYSPTNIISFLGRVNYTFKNKYVLTSSFRYDGVSKFQGSNRWSFFPSFALAWNASDESFIKSLGVFDELKVRAGWGQIGNHGIGPFQTLANYGGDLYATPSEGTSVSFVPQNIANENLIWETTEQINFGVDFGFWNNRITGTIDYYEKYTNDLLQSFVLPPSAGFRTHSSNLGEISNKGLEFLVNAVVVDKGDLRLTVG